MYVEKPPFLFFWDTRYSRTTLILLRTTRESYTYNKLLTSHIKGCSSWLHLYCCLMIFTQKDIQMTLKEKSGPGFNSFQKKSQTFSDRKVKIWCKSSKKVMKFWIFEIFMKHFLNIQYEYANKWVDDVIASQLSINFVHKNEENPIYQLWESKTCLKSSLNKCKIMFALMF